MWEYLLHHVYPQMANGWRLLFTCIENSCGSEPRVSVKFSKWGQIDSIRAPRPYGASPNSISDFLVLLFLSLSLSLSLSPFMILPIGLFLPCTCTLRCLMVSPLALTLLVPSTKSLIQPRPSPNTFFFIWLLLFTFTLPQLISCPPSMLFIVPWINACFAFRTLCTTAKAIKPLIVFRPTLSHSVIVLKTPTWLMSWKKGCISSIRISSI